MEWIDVNDIDVKIPYTKVCIWDGGNTFWAYLQKVEETNTQKKLYWDIIVPKGYGTCVPLY
jgi:hypothetical protein